MATTAEEALESLAAMCEALGAEKLPGRLRARKDPEDVRQTLAYLRARLDEFEAVMSIPAKAP